MGLTQDWFCDDDLTLIRQALDTNAEKMRGVTFEALMEKGCEAERSDAVRALAEGAFLTPSGKCEFYTSGWSRWV